MTRVEDLLARLSGVKKSGKGWSAKCPAHDDRHSSLSVNQTDDGTILVKCHAGCSAEAVVQAVGLELRDLFPPKTGQGRTGNGQGRIVARPTRDGSFATAEEAVAKLERQHGKCSALWTYRDRNGEPVGVVVRWDKPAGKDIRPVARHGDRWRIGAIPEPRPLYRLPELLAAEADTPIVVTEGEKAADAACRCGLLATTSAGGAQAAGKTDWTPLCGRHVVILPDHDEAGERYAEDVARLATAAGAARVQILRLSAYAAQLPPGGDIADVLDSASLCGLPLGDSVLPEDLGRWILDTAERAESEAPAEEVKPWRLDGAQNLTYRPFPVDALPEAIRGYVVAGSLAIHCDPSYLALPLLVALASAIGNTRRLELKRGWLVPPILWGAIIGESGTAKTAALHRVLRPICQRQQQALKRYDEAYKQYKVERYRWERDMLAWKKRGQGLPPAEPDEPTAQRFLVSDTTVEALAPILLANPRGLLMARDELSGWIGSFDRYAARGRASTDAASWLSMFNAESITVDRKTGTPRTIHVPRAAVCICGGIQPAILRRVLGLEHRENGLAARLLLAYPPRRAKRWTEDDIDPKAEAELVQLFDRLYELQPTVGEDGEPRPVLVRLSSEAKTVWTEYYDAHAVEQVDLIGDMASAWSKLEEYPARLALVHHFVRWASGDVADECLLDAASMTAGITLAQWFKHEARRVYAMLDETDEERSQRQLMEWIEKRGGTVTARQVQMGCRWLRGPGMADAALEKLVRAGHGVWASAPDGQRGRPTRQFRLSPVSTSTKIG